jgi:hypothetical protein
MGVGTRRLAELAGLPGWPLLLTDAAAAAYLSLTQTDFIRGVSEGALPATPAAPLVATVGRAAISTRVSTAPLPTSAAQDALGLAIDAWSRP